MFKNLYFNDNFPKISILIKILEYLDISKKNSQISIFFKIYKTLDFRQNLQKSWFSKKNENSRIWSKFS